MKNTLKITAAASVLLTAGCFDPAGSMLNEGTFADAATSNQFAQTAYLEPGAALQNLDEQFRRATPTMINFEFNRSVLDAESKTILRGQAAWMKGFPHVRFTVYGHTDLVGSNGYNNSLGQRRAQAAVNYLVSQGVPRKNLIAVVSKGESEPLIKTQDRERLNRRTVTAVSGFVKGYIGDDFDGKVAVRVYSGYVGG
ncbi:MAG: OmpA family protein [Rhodobacteraceae bacterium]|nr:OmpA family protein [Paracoccaceae bacterium]